VSKAFVSMSRLLVVVGVAMICLGEEEGSSSGLVGLSTWGGNAVLNS